ncbi:MAG TPA: ribosome maturation factor RimM [Candidatus Baltobacteraceae bacterium]|jgi:16S rRNA processing protein RimM|nr:ribosome maturation factor RimM [Candidatus Baltobacteraceae bacterium]
MPSNPNEVTAGRIAGLFGIHGELKCDPSGAGRPLFREQARFRAQLSGGVSEEITLVSVRDHKNRFLVRIEGVTTADEAQRYAGAILFADRARIVLEPGEFLDIDLEGCELVDPSGASLGRVERIEHYPSSDMLVVGGKLVPMVSQFITSIDLDRKRIQTDLPPGLL